MTATAPGMGGPDDPGFGIYVHWPFCASKCPYCDFNSHVRHVAPDEARFVAAFRRELATAARRTPGRTVSSIFLGGGTPSLMEPSTVGAVLEAISGLWPVTSDCEVTLEANPTSVEAERFRGFRAAGVNRVSLGVQALDDADLKSLGRTHSADEALRAVDVARRHFDRYSFDLIYARPGQTEAGWEAELRRAIAEAAEHLSLYQLTIEPGTMFEALHRAGKLAMPDDEMGRVLYDLTQAICAEAGLPAYEISNHARPGAECRHNLIYWRSGDFVGAGPGAHGRLTLGNGRIATATEKHPETWLARVEEQGSGIVSEEHLIQMETADEFLVMGLRLAEGIDLARYEALSGQPLDPERIAFLEGEGFVERLTGGRLKVTPAGFPVLNAVVADLAQAS
ncbi:anaerobic coproporphyrinogen III oxidase [Phreatobacter oligotrophus]|uniref:Heme chaperone HemW n=2 Tax=Phreatobacter oligotrophus TaxID=1122261 RepID=A0A2T4ZE17_9HYPH|nr:radical SAM family heme chaperone HemW [Phreatobacter oligotrophus]PTM60113.1 anaerobic coproporphyrinogen III oxidase [Phreatobacter oligotrophus]